MHVVRVNKSDLEELYPDSYYEATINPEDQQGAAKSFEGNYSSSEGKKGKDKAVEAFTDYRTSHYCTMSDHFTGEHDIEKIEAQELPLRRSSRVRRPPVDIHDMAMVAIEDIATYEEAVESVELEH